MDSLSTENSPPEVKFAEHLSNLTKIGKALSAESNIDRLLEMIVDEARSFTNADGGTLYIIDEERKTLRFAVIQNNSLNVRMGGTAENITWSPVKLHNEDGTPNYANVSSYAALSGDVVNISDVYRTEEFDFEGTRKFDAKTGYRSQSMLVVPMRNHENEIIGVLQLLNSFDKSKGKITSFSLEYQRLTESLASQAAVALTKNILIKDLEILFESFIRTIATAIDEKSPYTGNHGRRVVDLTMCIAEKINSAKAGHFRDIYFDRDQMDELRIAAWLHDVGKVAVPEYVMDKSTKLETVYDGIDTVKTRMEVLKRDMEIKYLRHDAGGGGEGSSYGNVEYGSYKKEIKGLDDDLACLERINRTSEFLSDDDLGRVRLIARRRWSIDGKEMNLLTNDEIDSLSVRRGTLNDRDRDIINSHTTIGFKMLSQIPFPKRLKDVPFFATAHHEMINGKGYPRGLKGDEIPLQVRIITFADTFEALTASDRPYKKGNTLSQAMQILGLMVKDRHLDADLFELFMKDKIYMDYAKKELDPKQIDDYV
ncbi:MAG: GAF domain-containing protein, partial [Deltaproteobacteria bacterium]|nr:GAF domain-containing protein [Deltaproteobacteria bacterium]